MSGKPIDEAVRAFEEHFQESSEDPSMEGELEIWLTAWNAALTAAQQQGQAVSMAYTAGPDETHTRRFPLVQQGQAVAEDMGGFTSDTAALAFLHIIGNGNPNVERAVERLRQSLIAQQPAPCAAVGVDAPGSRAWMAEVCRAAALSLAAHGVRNDQLSKVADWIAQQPAARPPKPTECMNGCPDRQVCDHCQWPPGPDQQPAAVDEAYPTPRNRAEAVALARLALAHLGMIDAHIDAAIARCETDLAAQQQGGAE